MRNFIDIIINEGEASVSQQVGQWARTEGGSVVDGSRVAVKVIDTGRYLAGSGIYVVIKVEKHQEQGFNLSVDLVLSVDANGKMDATKQSPLVDGHSYPRAERADEALRYANQLKANVNKILTMDKLKAAIAELSR
jgi:hypothetical protein